ncbi:MAG: hypothetical protein ACI4S4_07190, partial [Candidatus Ornithospirochaeta sp.]
MNAIIGEITTFFDENQELSEKTGELVYTPSVGGFALEAADKFSADGVSFRLITKLGRDMQGEMQLDMITTEGWADEDQVLYSSMPTSLSVDGSLIIRNTAPSSMKKSEILYLLKDVDKVYVSGLLLSFPPVKDEILGALCAKESTVERVVVNADDASRILLVEDLRDSLITLCNSKKECYLIGDIPSIDGVKRASSDLVTELSK